MKPKTDHLSASRLKASYNWPYLATAFWSMVPVEKPDLPHDMAVDQYWRVYYNPSKITQHTISQTAGILYHEVCHLLRSHHKRAKAINAEPMPWNLCVDAEIDDDLRDEHVDLPEGCIFPEMLGQEPYLFAETYYENLPDPPPIGGGGAGRGDCGSCATGVAGEYENPTPAQGGEGVGEGRAELVKRKVAEEIQQHARSRGSVPGQWERYAKEILNPKVSWTKELAASLRHAVAHRSGMVDYSFSRPSRRADVFPKIVLPSLRAPLPQVAVIIDTSGSMSQKMLEQALGEVKGVLLAAGMNSVPVIPCDAAAGTVQRVFDPKQVKLEGGGGTDMGAGMAAAAALKPRPHIVIVLTDGYTPWPSEPPPYKTIVGIFDDESDSYPVPAYAKSIRIPLEEE